MERDFSVFPDDANGDALWRMHENGDDLDSPCEFDFSVIFPSQEAALSFGVFLLKEGLKVSLTSCEDDEHPWELTVHPLMAPTYESICEFEDLLAQDAAELGGRLDGWGCFQV